MLSEEIGDSLGMSLGLRNLYGYYHRLDEKPETIRWFVRAMKEFPGDSIHLLRTMFIESYFEFKYGSNSKAISIIHQVKRLIPEDSERWFVDVEFARVTFLLKDENYKLTEKVLVDLVDRVEFDLSPTSTYKAWARLTQLYVLTDRIELAKQAYQQMKQVQGEIHPDGLEIGVYAKLAVEGVDHAYELDPVFDGVKKSGLSYVQKLLMIVGGIGMLVTLLIYFLAPQFLSLMRKRTWSKFG